MDRDRSGSISAAEVRRFYSRIRIDEKQAQMLINSVSLTGELDSNSFPCFDYYLNLLNTVF